MKRKIKLLSLALALIMTALTFLSCSGNGNSETQNTDSNGKVITEFNESESIMIFTDGKYTANVIIPDLASEAEKSLYIKIRAELKSKTGVNPAYTTDIIPVGQTRDPNEPAILLGRTNFDEAIQISDASAYGDYSLKVINNKVNFYFNTKQEGEELLKIFMKSIKTDNNGSFWIKRDLSISKQALPQLEGLPRYPANETTLVDCRNGTSMIVANRTTIGDFQEYCKQIEAIGYTLYSSRDNVNENYFKTFTKDRLAITAYFTSNSKSARIIAGSADDIPTKEIDTTPEIHTPTLTLLSQGAHYNNGLGMIYLLPNGKFLIIDGGYVRSEQLLNKLKSLAPDPQNIVITAWYISHTHVDHQRSLTTFLRDYGKSVKIESILYNYTTTTQYNAITTGADGAGSATQFENTLTKYLDKNTKVIKPHTGQIYNYGSTQVEILYTVEDVLPKTLDYLNTSSLVVRVKIGDHTMLALADTTHVSGDIMRNMFGSYLESEMVQLAHHGTYPGYASLYETIKGKVLIWPSNLTNAGKMITDNAVATAVKHASDVYVANSGDVTFTLPYTVVNNKQEFLNSIGSNQQQ